jgi:4-hydroxy-3-methylbut-2-enyl diphosphate reductase
MNIIRAEHLGMCFGVRDAIDLAQREAARAPLTILGDLVHNEMVLADLRARGIRIAPLVDSVATRNVMITAHGASDRAIQATRDRGHEVVEATCPLVHHAHRAARKLVAEGYHPVVVGQRGHVEVRGLTEDLAACDIVLTEAEIDALPERPRYGVVAQTTQPIARVRDMVARLRARFPRADVRFIDTVCQPTKQRQSAAVELARRSDVVIVIGGTHSNNTRELARTCREHCERVHQVQTADDLDPLWLADAETVGITAGTSTPDILIDGVERRLRVLAEQRVEGSFACAGV